MKLTYQSLIPINDKTIDDKLSDDKLSDVKLSDDKLSDDKLSDDKLSDDKLSDDKLSDDKLSKAKDIIRSLKNPSNEADSFKNFIALYECFTPSEWLNPDILFEISNYIARTRSELVDLGTRLNVQVNLYLRTIANYHSDPDKILGLDYSNNIGCFALTESDAGVLSGLIVDVKFEETKDKYILNSNQVCKKWISQGMLASKGLVIASNISNHRDCRIFIIDFSSDSIKQSNESIKQSNESIKQSNESIKQSNESIKQSNESIIRTQMRDIPVSKYLDLAEIRFDDLVLSKSQVLDKTIPLSRKEILTGIFYGRLCLAEVVMNSISEFVNMVYNKIKDIEKFKKIGHYDYIHKLNNNLIDYCLNMKKNRQTLLTNGDVMRINCYKIYCVETAIYIYNKIHIMFGTHAFGFGLDYQTLILNKIAEGDTSVLKLACIKEYLNKYGIIRGINYRHWYKISTNPIKYVMDNKDIIFDEIVGSQIDIITSIYL